MLHYSKRPAGQFMSEVTYTSISHPALSMKPPEFDFGQKFNGLAIVRGAKYRARQFLYDHGQAETADKISRCIRLPFRIRASGHCLNWPQLS
jgi:hypothetical protein